MQKRAAILATLGVIAVLGTVAAFIGLTIYAPLLIEVMVFGALGLGGLVTLWFWCYSLVEES